ATGEENTYEYDEYRVEVPYRETLAEEIEKNFDIWLTFARDEEIKRLAGSVRDKRNLLLAEYDWTQNADSPLAPEKKAEWAAYRQALRDIPEQEGFPYSVVWPAKPE
ncbi:MAG: hypothetical protein GX303_03180, partial [Clostridiales bacterium]|nr:hypothetical protein [Clostridiales bacterium]